MTVLVVDDRAAIGQAVIRDIDRPGIAVSFFSDYDRAVDFIKSKSVRVVLYIQHNVEDDQVFDLCRMIREKNEHYVYFIIAAALDIERLNIPIGLKLGVDAYLPLPAHSEIVSAMIQVGLRISERTLPENRKKGGLSKTDISGYDILMAKIALERGLVTKDQLATAFSFQKKERKSGNNWPLGDIFLKKKMLSPDRINDLHMLTQRQPGKKSRVLSMQKDFVNQTQVNTDPMERASEFATDPFYRKTRNIHSEQGAIDEKGHAEIGIKVSRDAIEAHIEYLRSESSDPVTPEQISSILTEHGILSGILDLAALADRMNSAGHCRQLFLVAQGRIPTPGTSARIEYHFHTQHLTAGTIDADGNMDYRARGSVPKVRAGDLIATKIPLKNGQPGKDIYGNTVPAPEPHDVLVKAGEGVSVSDDGLSMYAAIDGQPHLAVNGTVSVFAELVIEGDVNFNTGNIDFDGNVIVKGCIRNGFSVQCGHLQAQEISGAVIFALGDVLVSDGIIGSTIKTDGDLKAGFIADSNIKTFGSVVVDKEVLDSKIRASGRFVSPRGKIISSFVSAKMGFEAGEVGTQVSLPCRINVGVDENVKKRIQAFNYAIDDRKKDLETVQQRYENASREQEALHLKISDLAQLQERLISARESVAARLRDLKQEDASDHGLRLEDQLRELTGKFDSAERDINQYFLDQERLDEKISQDLTVIETLIQEIETIGEEKTAILKWSEEEKGDPVVKVSGLLFQETRLSGIYSSLVPKETLRRVLIREVRPTEQGHWQMVVQEWI